MVCNENEKIEDLGPTPVSKLGNWEAIKIEISCSNVIQRDNVVFARALHRDLVKKAKENDKEAKSFEKLWCEKSRKKVILSILEEWVESKGEKAVVSGLLQGLSVTGFMDVKLRVEKLVELNLQKQPK